MNLLMILALALARGIPIDSMPVPPYNPKQLFYLQRTPNKNTIVIELNDKNGVPDTANPVHVYWVRYTEHGERAELTYIQRTFAYGIKSTRLGPEKYELHFVSFKKYHMYLIKAGDHRYHVFSEINGKIAILKRVYIQIDEGGTLFKPNVEYIEIRGIDPSTGKEVQGRIQV